MIILHCLSEAAWNTCQSEQYYGEKFLESGGFIHCSDIDTFHKVAPIFKDISEPLVLLCIDTSKVRADIRWEDDHHYGTKYPHIYGLLNLDAVVSVLPFLKDADNHFILNEELQ